MMKSPQFWVASAALGSVDHKTGIKGFGGQFFGPLMAKNLTKAECEIISNKTIYWVT